MQSASLRLQAAVSRRPVSRALGPHGVAGAGPLWRPGDFPITAKARRKATRLHGPRTEVGQSCRALLSVGRQRRYPGVSARRIRPRRRLPDQRGRGLISTDCARPAGPRPWSAMDICWSWRRELSGRCPDRSALRSLRACARRRGVSLALPPDDNLSQPRTKCCGSDAVRLQHATASRFNVGAKNTVGITYIADAVDHGATVFLREPRQVDLQDPTEGERGAGCVEGG